MQGGPCPLPVGVVSPCPPCRPSQQHPRLCRQMTPMSAGAQGGEFQERHPGARPWDGKGGLGRDKVGGGECPGLGFPLGSTT